VPCTNRTVLTLSFFVSGKWHLWVPSPDGRLLAINAIPVDGTYFGDRPERRTDQLHPILHLLGQKVLEPRMERAYFGLQNDFQNLAAILAKMRLYYEMHRAGRPTRRFVETEVEYLVTVYRSVFDLLQEIIGRITKRIVLHDGSKIHELPRSFADITVHGDRPLSTDEIAAKYRLPRPLAEWYSSRAAFFVILRGLRDAVHHHGENAVKLLFCTDRGFGIPRGLEPFQKLHDWPIECELPNQIVPLRPALCSIVHQTIETCSSFADLLTSQFGLPPELLPGLFLYLRGEYDEELCRINDVLKRSLWCDA
jgi:hypothetical protein